MEKSEENLRKDMAQFLRKLADQCKTCRLDSPHTLELAGVPLVVVDMSQMADLVKQQGVMRVQVDSD